MYNSTPIPNIVFDSLLTHFSGAELKVFLIIIRKTLGWFDKRTGKRKGRDWIATSQFIQFTGLSDVSIGKSISSLSDRGYIIISDTDGNVLKESHQRQGMRKLFFSLSPELLKFIGMTSQVS